MESEEIQSLKVLVVDDNRHMRALLKTILYSFGVRECVEAGDGADGMKELKHFPADLIICDWNMSPLDGLDFARMVRTSNDSFNPFVPIILLTAHTERHRVIEARDAGIHEVLAKPISARDLLLRIKGILNKPRPFVRSGSFFGPDRRRKNDPNYRGMDRRRSPEK